MRHEAAGARLAGTSGLTSFVGRREETASVVQLLRENRLVTLAGAPGAGKTRLAVEVARAATASLRDGVRPVALATVAAADDVVPAVAAAVRVQDDGDAAVEDALVDALRRAEVLLLLDNAEHVADRLAVLLERLLAEAPRVRVLVTSRAPLGLDAEHVHRVAPLSGPEAVELFVDRMGAVAELAPDDAAREQVRRICERLDGLPLAIELVARQARALPLAELLRQVDDELSPGPSGPARRAVATALAWSRRLLTPSQATLFEDLAVLVGEFDLAAADAVAGPGGAERADLTALVDHSLVSTVPEAAGGMRYRMLEPVRQDAAAHLADRGGTDAVRRRHADHFLAVARAADRTLMRTDGHLGYRELARVEANVLAAVAWARTRPTDLALQLVTCLAAYWEHRGSVDEAQARIEALLDHGVPSPRTRAEALLALCHLGYRQGRYDLALERADTLIRIVRGLGDDDGLARALRARSMLAAGAGDARLAVRSGERSVELFRELGDHQAEAWSCTVLGLAYYVAGDVDQGARSHEAALRALEVTGPAPAISRRAHVGLTFAAASRRDVAAHRRHLAASIDDLRLMGALDGDAEWMWSAVTLAEREGRAAAALRIAGAVRARRRRGRILPPVADDVARAALARAAAQVGPHDADVLRAAGERLDAEGIAAEALAEPTTGSPLSERELEVARLTAQGLSNAGIAERLVISRRTVETHQDHIRAKLHLASRFEVIAWAMAQDHAPRG